MSDTRRKKASSDQVKIVLDKLRELDPHNLRWSRIANPDAHKAIQEQHLETRILYCHLGEDIHLEFRRRYTRWRQTSRVKMDILLHIDGSVFTVSNKDVDVDYRVRMRTFIDTRIEPLLNKYLLEGEYFNLDGDYDQDYANYLSGERTLVTLKGSKAEIKQQLGGLFVAPKSNTNVKRTAWNT